MEQEFETQILDIDAKEIAQKLRDLGAKETPEVLQKRWVFDLPKAGKNGRWIRIRQIGAKTTITYKNKLGTGVSNTQELETEVTDFEKAVKIFQAMNVWIGNYYQENKRHKFELENIEFALDTWPIIPTMLEIEGKCAKDVQKGLKMLDLEGKEIGHVGHKNIYAKYGIDLHSYKELKFYQEKNET